MNWFATAGAALVVIGLVEYVVFRRMKPHRENIRRNWRVIVANSVLNVTVGTALVAFS